MKNQVDIIAQQIQDDHDNQAAEILSALLCLNYWGKKIDKSRAAVISLVCEELTVTDEEVKAVINAEDLRKAKEPKKPKKVVIDNRPVVAGNLSKSEQTRPTVAGRKFLVTSAQNNTHVHSAFLQSLETYAVHVGAEIVIFPFIYNLNGFQNGEGADDVWYACEVAKYLVHDSVWLGEGAKVAAMAFNILPTAPNPLAGLAEAMGASEAMIVPHATIAMQCLPVLGAQSGAVVPAMYSTGTVTQRNYIQQAAGQKGEARHTFGALIVEFNDHGQWWIRQIETDESGEFQDLRNAVGFDGSECFVRDACVKVINYGDIHAEKLDVAVAACLWGVGGMTDTLQPSYQMMHDILDFSSLNHHNRENPHHNIRVAMSQGTVKGDLGLVADVLNWAHRPWAKTIVVRSNHDDALDRWLVDMKYDPRKDPANAKLYYQLQVAVFDAFENQLGFEGLPEAMRMLHPEVFRNVRFLHASESFKVGGVELGEHGHSGKNGSRGSPAQFRANRCTTGHTHSPSIIGQCYTAGVTGRLNMGYNETGASSWQQAHVVQYLTGYRAIVHTKDNGAGVLDWCAS